MYVNTEENEHQEKEDQNWQSRHSCYLSNEGLSTKKASSQHYSILNAIY